jgi:hypothetical protein
MTEDPRRTVPHVTPVRPSANDERQVLRNRVKATPVQWNWIVAMAASAVLVACGGGSAGGGGSTAASPATRASSAAAPSIAGARIAPGTSTHMCGALTAADLGAVGLRPELQQPEANPGDPPDSGAYCSFTRAAGANGGIEFDIFYPADHSVYQTVVAEGGGSVSRQPTGLAGIDEASIQDMGKGAGINVRRGTLVFAISIPSGPRSRDQLVSLATVVLGRTGK